MSPAAGLVIYYGILGAAALAVLTAAVWALLLDMGGNRRSSRDPGVLRGAHELRGTIQDTLTQIERGVRTLYKEPMEIVRSDASVSFRLLVAQPPLRLLRRPCEHLVFTIRDLGGTRLLVSYSSSLKRFRRLIQKSILAFILCVSIPALALAAWLAAVWVLPAFQVQGDLPAEIIRTRRQVLHVAQVVHAVWPPFLLLALFSRTTGWISREFNRLLKNIQHID
ncbi:MAG: hypothetical protein ABIF71_05995 [Planctomycetota bacterium]